MKRGTLWLREAVSVQAIYVTWVFRAPAKEKLVQPALLNALEERVERVVGVEIEAVELGLAGPRELTWSNSGSSPPRRTHAPARGPRATRLWTEALTRPASA